LASCLLQLARAACQLTRHRCELIVQLQQSLGGDTLPLRIRLPDQDEASVVARGNAAQRIGLVAGIHEVRRCGSAGGSAPAAHALTRPALGSTRSAPTSRPSSLLAGTPKWRANASFTQAMVPSGRSTRYSTAENVWSRRRNISEEHTYELQ